MTAAFNLAQLANNLNTNGQLDATDGLTGAVPVANGGTGQATLTANNLLVGNGTSGVQFVAAGTSGNVLTSNGTAWSSQPIASGGDYIMQVFSTPGTWTKPVGLKAIKVTIVGGGGGGASNPGSYRAGGGGGTSIEYIDAPAIPGPQPYTVGTGGTGGGTPAQPGPAGAGGTGGTTSFGGPTAFLSATGGAGGAFAPGATSTTANGGAGSNGQMNFNGTGGTFLYGPIGGCINFNLFTRGYSLMSVCDAAGFTNAPSFTPVAPLGYGVGGQGPIGPPSTGVAGSAGVVIVEEFY